MIALNSALWHRNSSDFRKEVGVKMEQGYKERRGYLRPPLRTYIRDSKPIRFEGNGYSDEWKEEAQR